MGNPNSAAASRGCDSWPAGRTTMRPASYLIASTYSCRVMSQASGAAIQTQDPGR